MKTNKILTTICTLLFLVSLASAQVSINIDVQDNFNPGEEVYFDYTITALEEVENLIYTPYVYCENSPQPLLTREEIQLNVGEEFNDRYIYGVIDDNYNTGECTASISVEEPYEQYVEKSFTITSREETGFKVKTCADSACEVPKKIFRVGEEIYFVYEADADEGNGRDVLEIDAQLEIPRSRSGESVELTKLGESVERGSMIIAEKAGTYNLKVTALKEGYKDVSLKYQFAVIGGTIRRSPPLEDEKGIFEGLWLWALSLFQEEVLYSPGDSIPTFNPGIDEDRISELKKKFGLIKCPDYQYDKDGGCEFKYTFSVPCGGSNYKYQCVHYLAGAQPGCYDCRIRGNCGGALKEAKQEDCYNLKGDIECPDYMYVKDDGTWDYKYYYTIPNKKKDYIYQCYNSLTGKKVGKRTKCVPGNCGNANAIKEACYEDSKKWVCSREINKRWRKTDAKAKADCEKLKLLRVEERQKTTWRGKVITQYRSVCKKNKSSKCGANKCPRRYEKIEEVEC